MTNQTSIAPIALFVYKRPGQTQQTIEASQKIKIESIVFNEIR